MLVLPILKRVPKVRSSGGTSRNTRIALSVMILLWFASLTPASGEDLDQHLAELKKRLPSPAFTIVREAPFFVVGDEPADVVRRRATDIVKWAVSRLKRDYFAKDPEEIIDVWLFKDKASYDKHTAEIFGDKPTTPYGYYSARHHALIMNIGTGGGTLVHEIVHPYMRANFPACPAWFNEGMGSLYEQSAEKDGHIRGLTNWRLPGLQQAIKDGKVLPFKELTALSDTDFYGNANGYSSYYGQSRYLCYYLQEKNLLVSFYREFVANQASDPTGFETLKKILREPDMETFKRKWEAYVSKLTFP